ncbi:MAG: hypothetical protein IKE01_02780 [Clostridia bacterium]|nr:hypothetical protein [Clostridia bacterium]
MFSKSGYNDNLKELIKAKKADKSIASVIKENLNIQADAKSNIKKAEKEIKQLNITGEDKKSVKMQIPFYNVKDYMNILMEIRGIKKQLKQKNNEVKALNKEAKRAEQENSEIEKEIDAQYKIYQENEIYTKAIDRINKHEGKISEESYAEYQKHIEEYNNSVYSIENNSKLPEPNAADFVMILNTLVELDKTNKTKTKKKSKSSKSEIANSKKA